MNKPQKVVIIGFKGSGKTAVGRRLAEITGGKFADTDSIVEDLYEEEMGERLTFREIYIKEGRRNFIELEEKAVEIALSGGFSVISLGGGTLINREDTIDLGEAIVVGLGVEKETLYKRIMKDGIPAFFDAEDPRGSFESFFEERASGYNRFAEITVDNSGPSPDDAAIAISEYVKGAARGFLEDKI